MTRFLEQDHHTRGLGHSANNSPNPGTKLSKWVVRFV